jgi:hypothetical protein
MTGPAIASHSPWPLFSQDLSLAREWLRGRWDHPDLDPQLLHWGLHLGMAEVLREWLQVHSHRISAIQQRKLWYRLSRLEGRSDAALAFLEPEALRSGGETLRHVKEEGKSLRIRLNAGIGDHLQDLALIHSWSAATRIPVILETEVSRQRQLQRLLANSPWLQLISTDCPPANHPLTSFLFTLLTAANEPSLTYKCWVDYSQAEKESPKRLVCCWRAEGSGDILSGFLRSVSLRDVLEFYQQLQAKRPHLEIVDISNWKPWEQPRLLQRGIRLHDPTDGDVAELLPLLRNSTVISIDTALCHLCACMGQVAWVLLPSFADERWQFLNQPQHCYGRFLQFLRQDCYGSWTSPLEQLLLSFN